MIDTKNALAELANEMSWIEAILCDEGYAPYCADANKAKRIIAELAKVEDRHDGETNSDVLWRCNDCIAKCRAIAEKGVNNGKRVFSSIQKLRRVVY